MNFLENLAAQLPFGEKSQESQYFFALNIGLSQITAAVWVLFGHNLDILGKACLPYEGNEDLVEKVPKVLDKALGVLEVEPQKVLFGVPDLWNLEDNLKEPYIKLLQKILKEYDLTPLAYVTTTNAIAFTLQKQEGIPPTAILLGIGEYIEVALLRGGKVVDVRNTKRSDHLFVNIEKLLEQFTEIEVLPSKILLFSTREGENLTKLRDDLMSYPWMQKLSFLHFPKIEILDSDVAMESVVIAGAFEIDANIKFKYSFSAKKAVEQHPQKVLSSPPKEDIDQKKVAKIGADDDLGFIKGDIKQQVQGGGAENLEEDETVEEEIVLPTRPSVSDDKQIDTPERLSNKIQQAMLLVLGKIKLKKLLGSKLAILPVAFLMIVLAYFLLVRATVTVFVEPRILEKDTEVIADPKATSLDEAKKIIPAQVIEAAVSGTSKSSATGSKQIGDPARGKVIIYNLTSSKVSFSQGTTMTSADGLKFTLDSSIQIASQSSTIGADFTTVIKPGKSDPVGATAMSIGPEGNLAAGTELSIAGYSKLQVVARVEEALSGGTSKEVKVVTSDDQKKLQTLLIDELRTKAHSEILGKLTGDQKIISEALIVVDGKYNFNKQINDVASEFSLSATIRFKGSAYQDADLRTIISKLVEAGVPDNFQLNLQDSQTQADVVKVEKDGKLIFKAKFRAKLLPKMDTEELKKQIMGRGIDEAVEKLKGLEGVLGAEIRLTPALPAQLSRLPWLERNISITITPK